MSEKTIYKKMPVMPVGKYKGIEIDKLPHSYLRWMLHQDFPSEILEIAKKKLESSLSTEIAHINVSKHALDTYSMRFLDKWDKRLGFASFVAMKATEAYRQGIDMSKVRFEKDGIIKEYEGIKWVFSNNNDLDYKELITVF